jgi:hypothetical protein
MLYNTTFKLLQLESIKFVIKGSLARFSGGAKQISMKHDCNLSPTTDSNILVELVVEPMRKTPLLLVGYL